MTGAPQLKARPIRRAPHLWKTRANMMGLVHAPAIKEELVYISNCTCHPVGTPPMWPVPDMQA